MQAYHRAGIQTGIIVLVLMVYMMVTDIAYYELPSPVDSNDIKSVDFHENMAMKHLEVITSFGPHALGTPELDQVMDYIHDVVKSYQTQFPGKIDIDIQTGSGNRMYRGQIGMYSNLSNLIVKVKGVYDDAIMISSHVDSSDVSYGSSDDGTPVVVMMEALRAILNQDKPYYSLIFLFDTGEEQGLFGAHLFAFRHPWYKHVKASINLEAMGAGGQDIVFRTNPGSAALLRMYSRVPRPHASIIGEDVFRSGLIGSDTDFTVYELPGLDLASVRRGQVYHTKFDNLENIPEGTLQFRGNNFLGMLKECIKVKDIKSDGRSLFFDVYGVFMVVLDDIVTTVTVIVIVASTFFIRKVKMDAVCTVLIPAAQLIGALLLSISTSLILATVNRTPYAGWTPVAVILYGIPSLIGMMLMYKLCLRLWPDVKTNAEKPMLNDDDVALSHDDGNDVERENRSKSERRYHYLVIGYGVFAVIGVVFGVFSLALLLIPMLFGIIGPYVLPKSNNTTLRLLTSAACACMVSGSFIFSQLYLLIDTLNPIVARVANTDGYISEIIMSALVALTIAVVCWVWPWYLCEADRESDNKAYYKTIITLSVLWFIVFVITLFTMPYDSTNPFKTGYYHVVDRTNGGNVSTLGVVPYSHHRAVINKFKQIPSLSETDKSCKFYGNGPELLTADDLPNALCSRGSIAPHSHHAHVLLVNKTANSFSFNTKSDGALRWIIKVTTTADIKSCDLDDIYTMNMPVDKVYNPLMIWHAGDHPENVYITVNVDKVPTSGTYVELFTSHIDLTQQVQDILVDLPDYTAFMSKCFQHGPTLVYEKLNIV